MVVFKNGYKSKLDMTSNSFCMSVDIVVVLLFWPVSFKNGFKDVNICLFDQI